MRARLTCAILACATASAAFGGEHRVEINNTYPMNEEVIRLRDRAYFTQDNKGYFEVVQGPIENGPARCIGSGFYFAESRTDNGGICIFGKGADTFTMIWKVGKESLSNDWTIAAGTGRYESMTGKGIATTGAEIMFHAMPLRRTHIIGTVEIPNE